MVEVLCKVGLSVQALGGDVIVMGADQQPQKGSSTRDSSSPRAGHRSLITPVVMCNMLLLFKSHSINT